MRAKKGVVLVVEWEWELWEILQLTGVAQSVWHKKV